MDNIKDITQKVNYEMVLEIPYIKDTYIVEVIKKENGRIEIWLSNKNYGIKTLMFGVSKLDKQCLKDIIMANIETYIQSYREEYEDEQG